MAVESKFKGNPLQVPVSEKTSDLVDQIAKKDKVSRAHVVRDVLDAGLARRAKQSGIA